VTSIHPDFDSRIWKHCTSLTAAGCEVFLVCPWDVPQNSKIKEVSFVPFVRATQRIARFFIPFRVLKCLLPLLSKIDLIHFHDLDLLPLMTILSLFKPVVYDVHENYPEEMLDRHWIPNILRKPLYYTVYACQYLLSRVIRNVILVAPSQMAQFKHPGLHIFYLLNFASLSLIDEVKNDYIERSDTVIFTGSGYESNGIWLLLEIARLLKPLYPQLKFILPDRFGSAKLRDAFMCQIEEKGLRDTVVLFPNMPPHKIMSVLNQATIAIAPNLRIPKQEMAIPTKLFEYMAASLPIVSSDLPYASELFSQHPVGILAQPESPASFVQAIQKLLDNRSLGYEMGKNGQKAFVTQFSWESQISPLISYYASILNSYRCLTS
jgi:glycosyltransferase involved in cell wall biosynthesis